MQDCIKLYFIRHGMTDANERNIIQGWKDYELNNNGICYSRKIADYFISYGIDAIVSSDLKRAFQTAKIISEKLRIPIHYYSGLRERMLGNLEGKYEYEAKENVEEGVESVFSFALRVKKVISNIKKEYCGKKVVVVTHGGVISIYYKLYLEKITNLDSMLNNYLYICLKEKEILEIELKDVFSEKEVNIKWTK